MCAASRPASLCLCAPLLVLLLPVLRRLFSVLRQCYFADCAACALHGLSPTGRACVWRGETRVSVAPTIRGPAPGPPTSFAHIISDIGVARGLVPKFGEVCCMHHDACCPRSSGSPGDRHACLLFAAGRFVRAKRSVRRLRLYRSLVLKLSKSGSGVWAPNSLSLDHIWKSGFPKTYENGPNGPRTRNSPKR